MEHVLILCIIWQCCFLNELRFDLWLWNAGFLQDQGLSRHDFRIRDNHGNFIHEIQLWEALQKNLNEFKLME